MRINSTIRNETFSILLPLIIFIVLSYIVNLSSLYPYDKDLLYMINSASGSKALDTIILTLTDFGGSFFWLLFIIVLWIYGKAKERRFAIFLAITIIASVTLGLIFKAFLYRPRPYELLTGINLIGLEEYGSSFPSGHSVRAFAGSTLIFKRYGRIASPLLALSLAVALSRVYLGVHYPTDVIAGALLGLTIANFIFVFTKRPSLIIDKISNIWMNFSRNLWRKMIFLVSFCIILSILSISFILIKEPNLLNLQYIISNLPIILDLRNFFDYGLIFLWPLSALSLFIYPLLSLFLQLISALLILSAKKIKGANLSDFTLKTGLLLFTLSIIIIASALSIFIYLFIGKI
ncbi:MAG: phosphatase PAP2 family protein [archaeon]|nr:phosphatase PAP2 family protein [archaeon]MCP8314698.1 phosphatase PAP2 family protein [archaeon]MCP8317381.1 phosphatase PAP2 family protein [archaeon]MCP8319619.1 phosphatase PAP2 family protein [archaeon]